MKRMLWSITTALLLTIPIAAWAASGYTTGNVNLRAGPDVDYPAVDVLPVGTAIDVQGCTEGWEWCDVIGNGNRGWIAGNYIQYMYNNQPVLVPAYGAQIGIPIVTFSIGTYWGRYYSGRPFYRDRARWYSRPMPHRPPPPPLHRPGGNRPGPAPGRPGVGGPGRPPQPGNGNRPPPRPQPGNGNRPTPGRPSPGGNRPTPGRPSPGGNRPTPGPQPGGGRPPQGGNRPPANSGNRPPQGGNRPQQTRPAANRPPPNKPNPPNNGNNGN